MQGRDRHGSNAGSVARSVALIILAIVLVGGLVWRGIASRTRAMSVLTRETRELAIPSVSVITLKRGAPQEEIVLPGSMQAFLDAPIYARTNGYLRRRYVDLGARVTAGQLLAEIDAPELDQQLQQARADLSTAQANLRLAQITADRYLDLGKTDSVAQQDIDNATGTLDARKAAVESSRHNVQRLEQLQAFTKIYAPFDGVITARNTDIGALIDSGSSGGVARELFHIAQTGRLRVFVTVPEVYSRAARPGLNADLTFAEYPGRRFTAVLVRTAEAIDVASRTLLTEFEIANPAGELLPGAYAEVHLKLPAASSTYLLPVNALLFRGEGLRIAIVMGGSRIALVSVTVGRDFGTEVEVVSGLAGDEQVVVNPPDSLVDGQRVQISRPARLEGTGGTR
jgi:RND family efflux transporter MFP subunit